MFQMDFEWEMSVQSWPIERHHDEKWLPSEQIIVQFHQPIQEKQINNQTEPINQSLTAV